MDYASRSVRGHRMMWYREISIVFDQAVCTGSTYEWSVGQKAVNNALPQKASNRQKRDGDAARRGFDKIRQQKHGRN